MMFMGSSLTVVLNINPRFVLNLLKVLTVIEVVEISYDGSPIYRIASTTDVIDAAGISPVNTFRSLLIKLLLDTAYTPRIVNQSQA